MAERETERVERLAAERDRARRPRIEDVALFTDEWIAAQAGLNADLIAPAGGQLHFDQRGLAE